MENLKAFFTRRPERLLGRCGMLFLMAFFVMNLSSCNDDLSSTYKCNFLGADNKQ